MTNNPSAHSYEEIVLKPMNGMAVLILNTLAIIAGIVLFVYGCIFAGDGDAALGATLIVVGSLASFVICPVLYAGLKVLKPNEAYVFTLFGKYVGTVKGEGFHFVNPFCVAVNPAWHTTISASGASFELPPSVSVMPGVQGVNPVALNLQGKKKISLKVLTLSNDKQKINDQLGNPIIIGIVVIWRVVDTARAVFSVDNYKEYLSIQCDSALRNIVRLYPYDAYGDDNEKSLRGSSEEVAEKLKDELQSKVQVAGLEIIEARITNLSYAQEIAAVMLQRQQASAIIDARQMIVEGAVGMVEMALAKLNEKDIVKLDEERKAAMVSNLLVVLCGNKDAQPIVNSGTIY